MLERDMVRTKVNESKHVVCRLAESETVACIRDRVKAKVNESETVACRAAERESPKSGLRRR